jgi:hypothetical protein
MLSLNEYDTLDIINILIAANELSLQELIILLQSFLIENKSEWMELNFNNIYRPIFENDSFSELQEYCNVLMSKDQNRIFKSLNFSSTPEKLLVKLIQNDNLQMSEVQVWEHVIKWGHAQNPELPSDPTNFSKEDFNTLKNSLQQCTPFIKFYNLTSGEFSDKVLPYKRILPKELYKDLLKHYLKPNNQSIKEPESCATKDIEVVRDINLKHVDSKIISFQHVELILKWILNMNNSNVNDSNVNDSNVNNSNVNNSSNMKKLDIFTIFSKVENIVINKSLFYMGKDINKGIISIDKDINKGIISMGKGIKDKGINKDTKDEDISTNTFKLLLRGTRDGFTPEKFHEICDDKSHTVTIIKVKDSNEILGGYTPIAWKSNDKFGGTKDSFIFSFKNNNIEDNILSLVRIGYEYSAIHNSYSTCSNFGIGDLNLYGDSGFCIKSSYEKQIRETTDYFLVEEYEVFQIIRD